jgi:hypothetical protein
MQHLVGQTGDTREADTIIQIADNRHSTQTSKISAVSRIAHQCIHAVSACEQGDGTQCYVAAADNQYSFHG